MPIEQYHSPDRQPPFWKSDKPKTTFITWIVIVVVLLAGANFALASTQLILERDLLGILKIATISLSATAAAYGVNRLAVEMGAAQSATGFWLATITSNLSILIVGISLFISTNAGLTRKSTEEVRLHEHGAARVEMIAERNKIAVQGNRFDSVLRGIVAVLDQRRGGELARGTISGRRGGRGPITRFLEEKIARARAIVDEKRSGEGPRRAILGDLNQLMVKYRRILAQINRDIWDRRVDLEQIDVLMEQKLALLAEAQPIALIAAYARELESGVVIAGRPQVTARLNAIFKSHGNALTAVLDELNAGDEDRLTFPSRTSVSDTLAYIGHFIPITMVVAVTELVLPISVWVYVFIREFWERYCRAQAVPSGAGARRSRGGGDDISNPDAVAPIGSNGLPPRDPYRVPDLESDPIDGPHGWSGRSRFNSKRLDEHGEGDDS